MNETHPGPVGRLVTYREDVGVRPSELQMFGACSLMRKRIACRCLSRTNSHVSRDNAICSWMAAELDAGFADGQAEELEASALRNQRCPRFLVAVDIVVSVFRWSLGCLLRSINFNVPSLRGRRLVWVGHFGSRGSPVEERSHSGPRLYMRKKPRSRADNNRLRQVVHKGRPHRAWSTQEAISTRRCNHSTDRVFGPSTSGVKRS